MRVVSRQLAMALVLLACAHVAWGQTADEVVAKCVTAMGGRAAFAKLQSRSAIEVDGIQLPFRVRSTSSVQNFTIAVTKVEHNVRIDETLFSKPAAP